MTIQDLMTTLSNYDPNLEVYTIAELNGNFPLNWRIFAEAPVVVGSALSIGLVFLKYPSVESQN